MEIVAILCLISLFTHNHIYWIAGLLLAFVQIPDFSTPLDSIARSLAKLSEREAEKTEEPAPLSEEPAEATESPPKVVGHGGGI